MDSLTQIVLGASVAEAAIGKKVGNKAPLWGAIAGTIPDLDVLGRYFLSTVDNLAFHRSFTHSITFSVIAAPLLAWLITKIYPRSNATFGEWTAAMFLSFFTHPLLDAFTTWGTMLFWPFSEYRIAIKSIFVIDPLYTLPFLVLLVLAMTKPRTSITRKRLNEWGILISTAYLFFTLFNKVYVDTKFQKGFDQQKEKITRFDSRPTPFNSILWAANGESASGFYLGYYSLFDEKPPTQFRFVPKKHVLAEPFASHKDVETLKQLTDGFFTVEPIKNGYAINDLRFGEVRNFRTDTGFFVFSYHMDTTNWSKSRELTFEQNRTSFKGMDEALSQLWERLKGNKP